jgi:hypothetical protein
VLKARDPELALNKVAEQFPLTGHITDFTLTYADDSWYRPANRPRISAMMSGRRFCAPNQRRFRKR